ncbi:MAG: UvrD-helicase domain-containing protein, partial [Acutalibacteraceae bacterium]|nr:UvrD-helicase domain-containing protein [Acutalibacteraceae bacterium]
MDFLKLRREVIKKYFDKMNDRQFEAVTTVNGPLLVLAGAGSGKTTVLVNRILNLVKFGDAYNSDFIPEYSENEIAIGEALLEGRVSDIPDG